MKILHVANFSAGNCGIKNFALQTSTALRRAGCDVTDWDGHYSTIYAKIQRQEPSYLPLDADTYDVLHFTWNPLAINHYNIDHFGPLTHALLSIYLTDLPPYSACPAIDSFPIRVAAEEHPLIHTPRSNGCILPYPIIDWVDDLPPAPEAFTVGWTGLRGDGIGAAEEVCRRRGWATNFTDRTEGRAWLSPEDEVRRLAKSTVNVCWYHEYQNIASAPSMCLASHRPLLLNGSAMFMHLSAYADELYLSVTHESSVEALEEALHLVYLHWQADRLRVPATILTDLSWAYGAQKLIATWQEAIG